MSDNKRVLIESSLKDEPIQLRLCHRDDDILVLRLESLTTDPEILEEYPESVVVWQSILLDPLDVAVLISALRDWMDNPGDWMDNP